MSRSRLPHEHRIKVTPDQSTLLGRFMAAGAPLFVLGVLVLYQWVYLSWAAQSASVLIAPSAVLIVGVTSLVAMYVHRWLVARNRHCLASIAATTVLVLGFLIGKTYSVSLTPFRYTTGEVMQYTF